MVTHPQPQKSMAQLVAGLETKAAKIRALYSADYSRAEIARYLGISYQHVHNVLTRSDLLPRRAEVAYAQHANAPVHAEDQTGSRYAAEQAVGDTWLQVSADGRTVIPASYRRLLGLDRGGQVLAVVRDGALCLVSRDKAFKELQEMVARLVGDGSMVDDLIAERRREAARESGE